MQDRESGISYTEFSYMLLQALDFMHLCREHGCRLQIGGGDQWGNITAGIDLCRKKLGRTVHGLTLPLITNSDGTKFGKTAEGAVWLDPGRTSPYRFYQFWMRTGDRDAIRYLRYFTFLDRERIGELQRSRDRDPHLRLAQKSLAREMTGMIHGPEAAGEAEQVSGILFGGGLESITERAFGQMMEEIPSAALSRSRLGAGMTLLDLAAESRLLPSRGQARQMISRGGLSLNNRRETDPSLPVGPGLLLFGRYLLLRKGKKDYLAVRFDE